MLNDREKKVFDCIRKYATKKNNLTNNSIITLLALKFDLKISERELRYIVHDIRMKNTSDRRFICSGDNGYFVSSNLKDISLTYQRIYNSVKSQNDILKVIEKNYMY